MDRRVWAGEQSPHSTGDEEEKEGDFGPAGSSPAGLAAPRQRTREHSAGTYEKLNLEVNRVKTTHTHTKNTILVTDSQRRWKGKKIANQL